MNPGDSQVLHLEEDLGLGVPVRTPGESDARGEKVPWMVRALPPPRCVSLGGLPPSLSLI